MANNELLKLRYEQLLSLWHSFCEQHTTLFELTCVEYTHLLKSDIESLEKTLEEKDLVLESIRGLEKIRVELIRDINSENHFTAPVTNISSLLLEMQNFESTLNLSGLKKYNQLLINIIENIQGQNKKNQSFLNKALNSIEELKQGFSQGKSYQTYDQKGLAKKNQLDLR